MCQTFRPPTINPTMCINSDKCYFKFLLVFGKQKINFLSLKQCSNDIKCDTINWQWAATKWVNKSLVLHSNDGETKKNKLFLVSNWSRPTWRLKKERKYLLSVLPADASQRYTKLKCFPSSLILLFSSVSLTLTSLLLATLQGSAKVFEIGESVFIIPFTTSCAIFIKFCAMRCLLWFACVPRSAISWEREFKKSRNYFPPNKIWNENNYNFAQLEAAQTTNKLQFFIHLILPIGANNSHRKCEQILSQKTVFWFSQCDGSCLWLSKQTP